MKKITLITIIALTLLTNPSQAHPLNTKQIQEVQKQPTLRDQMDKMILSIADLDILVNRDKVTDYEIFKEDAERILQGIEQIRKIDSTGIFKSYVDELEKPTKKLLQYSLQKNPKAMSYPNKIFNACFRCHKDNRDY